MPPRARCTLVSLTEQRSVDPRKYFTGSWLCIRLKRSMACSRRRNGRCEFSARLFSQRPACCRPDPPSSRNAAR